MKDFRKFKGDTLYLKLYNCIKKKIESEKLKGKLPPVRKTAENLNISINTVIKTYELLEKNSYITAKKGSGFFITYNKNQDFYPEDHMKNEDFKYSYFNNQCEINFSSASPKTDLFPIEMLKSAICDILDRYGEKALLYENPQGNIEFRNTIKKEANKFGIKTSVKNIQIISGAQQGINIISKILVQPGDIIVSEEPTYKGAIQTFKENGGKIKTIPLENDGINIDALEQFLKFNKIRLLYIIPIFQNPTGISLSSEKAKKLVSLAEKYDFYIVEDDSSSDLYFDKPVKSIKNYDCYNRVIYIKSYSKIFMPGFRLGFMILPTEITEPVIRAKYISDISTSGLNQRIFHHFMKNKIWGSFTENLREEFGKKQDYLYKKLKNNKLLSFEKPQGGLSFWIKLPDEITGEAIYFKLLKKGVSIIPGVVFSPKFVSYIRLSFAQCSYEDIDKGIVKLEEVLDELVNLNLD